MLNSQKPLERFLQQYRFKKLQPYMQGSVLDFGGNRGELRPYVKGDYTLVNYDHEGIRNKTFDTIAALAVIEHMEVESVKEVFALFKTILAPQGVIFLTTPAPMAKPVLEILASLRLLDKDNIAEHKHYWSKDDILTLAERSGFELVKYKKFQIGFNQFAVFKHRI
jgi:cyclopropane fatty-acyl-phospholipid synthase-like methyltransferase